MFPPSPVALEEAGGTALFCGAAEPGEKSGRGALTGRSNYEVVRKDRQLGSKRKEWLVLWRKFRRAIPAHGVILVRVSQAGALQLTGHEGRGALVPSQVTLQP